MENKDAPSFKTRTLLIHLGLVLASSVLFAASFPNPLFKNGLPFFAWFALIPALLIIPKYNLPSCAGWGAIYGCTAYAIFNYWLGAFHPMAGTIVYCIYLVYLALVFCLFKLADIFFPKRAYLLKWLIWLAYEYLRTKGFLGYSYGIFGYSQWRIIPLIQIACVTGVFGISAIVTFPSFWLSAALKDWRIGGGVKEIAAAVSNFFRMEKIAAIVWAAALAASLVFGIVRMKDFSGYPAAQIALVQHNADPWEATKAPTQWQITEAYRRDLVTLVRLSDEALSSEPVPDLVVWPETAFIPRIHWHTTYRDDRDSWGLVRELLIYLSSKDVPFLIGNDDGRRDPAINPDPEEKHRIDYNAAMLFEGGINTGLYRKLHLVPFTEHFPYKNRLPFFHDWLEKADTHFWEKGEIATVFEIPKFSFSSPICFEDSFGYLSRNFVAAGANVLVNLSNDAWSGSLTSQYQHLSMAVFRAVENYRPMVRSTSSGQTCAIDPNGRVTAMAAPFQETWINVSIPLVNGRTLYTRFGDFLGVFFTCAAVFLLLLAAAWCIMRKLKKG